MIRQPADHPEPCLAGRQVVEGSSRDIIRTDAYSL